MPEPTARTALRERIDAALRTVGLARNLAAYRDAGLPVVEEALAEQRQALAAQIALYKSAENDVTELTQTLRAVEIDRDQWRDRAHVWRTVALDAAQPKETR